jgi:[lysine-biosynthesis-protein LysW]--L-2-aminoadipate ligase
LRWEEKVLKREADKTGHEAELVDAKRLKFQISPGAAPSWVGDAVLQRCIGHYRSISLTRILENYGIDVVNQYTVSEACGNKLATTMLLAGAHVPTPKTFFALTADAVDDIAESVGFPLVLKPLVGSWGRMVSIAKDMETLTSLVELRGELPNPIDHMYYVQEYVRRPPRDIRAIVTGDEIVATVFRNSSEGEWRTNVARGASTESFRP